LNRVTSIAPPGGSGVSISYGTASKTATRGSLTESTPFDGFGRPTSITLSGIPRSYRYDVLGRMTFASNPGSSSGTSYAYDALDRVTRVTNADSSARSISYGAGSKTVTDERGKSTSFTYRSYGEPSSELVISVLAADVSASVGVARNAKDLVTTLTQNGIARSFGYNSNGYLTQVTHPETGTTSYGRDAAGNMTSRSVGASGTTAYGYDSQNRLTSVTYPGATPSVTKTYTRTHKQKTVSSSAASKVYGYDANDNLVSESLTVDSIAFNTGYAYNSLDQLSSITYPRSSRTISYTPDPLGRPNAVSGFVSSIAYWPSGQVKTINHVNGAVSSYGQNSRLWPSNFVTSKGTATWVSSSYGYDGAGNLTSISDSADAGFNRTLAYDSINRVSGASGPWGAGSIAYNGAGNITSQTQGSFTLNYAYDAQNRLSSVSGARSGSFGYDSYGDIVSASDSAYTYDGVPNLTCVNCADTANKVAYTYDGLNRRVTATKNGVKTYEVYGSNGNLLLEYTPAEAGKTVEYIYLGGKRIAQVSRDNVTTTTVTASPNPAGSGQPVLVTATIDGVNPSGTVTFFAGTIQMGTGSVAAGKATFTAHFSGPGTRLVTASYGGDANNKPSTSPALSMLVNTLATSTTTLAAGPNPAAVNQPVTMTATVAGSAPTGSVSFKDGATILGTGTVVGGKATFTTSFTSVGPRSLSATYGGDASNAVSMSSAVALTVNALAASTATLSASANPAATGHPVTLTAIVAGNNPSGSVSFRDGGTLVLGTAALSAGKATLSTAFTTTGTHSLSAAYGGDAANAAAVSPTLSLAVNLPATATTTSWSVAPVTTMTVGTNQWLIVKVAPAVGGNLACDPAQGCSTTSFGQVQLRDGSTVLGTAQVEQTSTSPPTWTARLSYIPTAVGTHGITAQYLGTTVNAPSSVSTTINVAPAIVTTTSWSSTPVTTMTVGTSQRMIVTVAPAGGGNLACDATQGCNTTSFGQVQLRDGSTVVDTAQVQLTSISPSTWAAGLNFTPTTSGTHSLTAQYLGTAPNAASSASATINVAPAIVTTTAWSSTPVATMTVGTTQWLRVTVAPAGGGSLACDSTQGCSTTSFGQVQLRDGSTVIGTAQVQQTSTSPPSWTASLNFTPTTSGTHSLVAQYLGTTPNAPSSVSTTINVAPPIVTTTTWSSTPVATMTVGTSQRMMVTVAPAGGGNLACDSTQGCSTTSFGQVQLRDGSSVVGTAQVQQTSIFPPIWTAGLNFTHRAHTALPRSTSARHRTRRVRRRRPSTLRRPSRQRRVGPSRRPQR
jgi:YD repeat-containing protein